MVNSSDSNFPVPKLKLSVFDETKPRWWIRRCEKLFNINQVADNEKVNMATTYLNDVGDI